MAHQEFHDDHTLDLGRSQIGEESAALIIVHGKLKEPSPQRFNRRLSRSRLVEDEVSSNVPVQQCVEIAKQGVELNPQDELTIPGLEVELERCVRLQYRRPGPRG